MNHRLLSIVKLGVLTAVVLTAGRGGTADDKPTATAKTPERAPTKEDAEFFEKKVRPVLVQYCYECHAADSKKRGGGLLLDSREGMRKGGDSGAVVVPEKPEESLLITAIRYGDESLKMPPKGKLPETAIAALEEWVKRGAPDPREKGARPEAARTGKGGSWDEILRIRRQWWSLQPVRKPAVPQPAKADWSDDAIDRFILAKLEEQKLAPAPLASPVTLIRRLSLVLTGLPPTVDKVAEFVREYDASRGASGSSGRPAVVAKLVDSLLASPHFGERWARHWMDVVRFTETHGNEWNYEVHHAWRYRDYLIRAINTDVPYNQLIVEHIAGDRLPQPRWNAEERFNESIIGTAFFRFGEVNHDDCIDLPQLGYDIVDNQIDTLSKAFQATTIACARCHDHKLDAISMQDYYALLGILRSSRLVSHTIDAPDANAAVIDRLRSLKADICHELAEIWLREAGDVGKYLLAAEARRGKQQDADELALGLDAKRLEKWSAALAVEKMPVEDLLSLWRTLSLAVAAAPAEFPTEWKKLVDQYTKEDLERSEFNRQGYETWADFRKEVNADWQVGGQGLRIGVTTSGELALGGEGETIVTAVLPAGCFTHTISDKLNGTLRSPLISAGKKHISFEVLGQQSSAVRLVSNNCQLNYKNYRALISNDLGWITFSLPDNRDSLRMFAELMTKFDNPKFPDQLSSLGGDSANYRLPWEKAAADPRSFFGIRRIVMHDRPEPPKLEVTHFRTLLGGAAPMTLADVAQRFAGQVETAVRAWEADKAGDDDVRWLNGFVRRGLLGNSANLSPRLESLVREFRAVEATLTLPRIVPGIDDYGPGFDQPIFARGDCIRPGEVAPRRYLEVLSPKGDSFTAAGSGRLELARRVASPDNPLTARVMVNRVWHHLFGSGLVRTVDDFGHVGDVPSHPELLDYLAARFVEEGWSIKRLIRAIVLTRTFQLANQPSPAAQERDPQNRFLQHYPARRMEAEAVRDSILAASGRLDRSLYGMSVAPFRESENADRRLFAGPLDGNGRRSVYTKNTLMEAPKFLGAFNFPGGKVSQGRRDLTNVPAQALALLNDPFVLQQADLWAESLVACDDSVSSRIDSMFAVAFGRQPRQEERDRLTELASELSEVHQVAATDILKSRAVWRDIAHAIFNLKEFIYIP